MKRKVSKLGQSTLMVSLPSKWVKSVGIKVGDEVEVNTDEKSLTVTPKNIQPPPKRIGLDVSDADVMFVNYLIPVLYKVGYNEVEIKFSTPEQFKVIQKQITEILIGYEIVSQISNTVLIKSISSEEEQQYDELERRLFLVLLSFADETLKLLESKEFHRIDEVLVLENTINRLSNYCERILLKYNVKQDKSTLHYLIVWLIESIGDDIRDILKYVKSEKKLSVSKEFLLEFKKVIRHVRIYYELFYSFSPPRACSAYGGFNEYAKELREKFQKVVGDRVLHYYLLSLINRLRDTVGTTYGIQY